LETIRRFSFRGKIETAFGSSIANSSAAKSRKRIPQRDFIRLGQDFHIAFLYGDVADASEFLRSARSIWLEIKSDNVKEMTRKILDFGVRKL
jgi:hypothetical protein